MPANMDSENRTAKQNDGDHNRIDIPLARKVIDFAQSWLRRLSLKMTAAAATAVSAYVFGKWGFSQDNSVAVGAGVAAILSGGVEIALSYLNMKLAPKAQPVE